MTQSGITSAEGHEADSEAGSAKLHQSFLVASSIESDPSEGFFSPGAPVSPMSQARATIFDDSLDQDYQSNVPFQNPIMRPSFPSAPSKVLAEQDAIGGSGHIGSTKAHESAPNASAFLEGVYPHPKATKIDVRPESDLSSEAKRLVPKARSNSSKPIVPNMAGLADMAEPNMTEMRGLEVKAAVSTAFTEPQKKTFARTSQIAHGDKNSRRFVLVSILTLLTALVAFAAYSQFMGPRPLNEPIRIVAFDGPDRIIPADPGGLQVEGQDLSVLNPEIQATTSAVISTSFPSGELEAIEPIPFPALSALDLALGLQPSPMIDEELTIIEDIDIPIIFEGAVAANSIDSALDAIVQTSTSSMIMVPETEISTSSRLLAVPPISLYVQEGAYLTLNAAESAFAALLRSAPIQLDGIKASYFETEVDGQTWFRLYLTGFSDGTSAREIGANLGRSERQWLVFNG